MFLFFFSPREERFESHSCEWPFILVHEITRQILLFLLLQLIYTFVATSIYLNSFLAASANYKPLPLHPFQWCLNLRSPQISTILLLRTFFPLVRNQCLRFAFPRTLYLLFHLSSQCIHGRIHYCLAHQLFNTAEFNSTF